MIMFFKKMMLISALMLAANASLGGDLTVGFIMNGIPPITLEINGEKHLGHYSYHFKNGNLKKGGFVGVNTKVEAICSDDQRLVTQAEIGQHSQIPDFATAREGPKKD